MLNKTEQSGRRGQQSRAAGGHERDRGGASLPKPTPGERRTPGALGPHQVCLKPALRLLERSPVGVSLTEPVTLNGPPNSFCSALSVRSHLSSVLEMSAPNDTLVSVGRKLKRS